MKTRKHHNNKGIKQIKNGKAEEKVKRIAKKLGIKYGLSLTMQNEMEDNHFVSG